MMEARAVIIDGKGEAEVMRIGTLGVREAGPGELLIEVAAAGLNRADIMQRRGLYPAPPGAPAQVPGLEYAGRVAQLGDGVLGFAVGDRVMGIVAGGGMATRLVVHAREAIRVPQAMSLTDAAAVPEAFLTAYDAMFVQAGVGLGQIVLLHAIGSGVGTAALALALAAGAHPIGTARTEDKLDRCRALGLSDGILVTDKTFALQVMALSGGRGADVILDSVGAAYLNENLSALAIGGRLVVIGMLGGATAELPLGMLMVKRARILGTVLRARPLEEKATLAQRFTRDVLPLFERGAIKPVVDRVLPMHEIQAAHRLMEQNQNVGKIVLTWT